MSSPVLLPAAFIFFTAKRTFLAIADGFNPFAFDTCPNQLAADLGATLTQREIVFGSTKLVAMPFYRNVEVRMLFEKFYIVTNSRLLI